MAKNSKSAMGFIMVTMLIDFTGFGIIIPVLPKLIQEFTGGSVSVAADYGGYLMVAFALAQFIFSPIMGGLSDQYGRRPILLFSLFGLGIDYIFLSFAPTIFWLFIGRIVAGITGASFSTAMAYIADVSEPEKKAQNFGLVGAAFGVGFILGPVIGGIFSNFGLRVPFMISAGLALVNWLYGYFILPESLAKEKRRNFSWKRANPVGSFLNASKYPAIVGLLFTLLLLYIASHSVQSNWSYYVIEKFKWDSTMIGYSLGIVGLMVAIVQGGLIRVIVPKIGNKKAIYLGLGLYIIGFTCFAFASNGVMMMIFIIPYCLAGIGNPAMQSIISNQVPENAQGEIQGIITGLQSLAAIIGPWVASHIFVYFIQSGTPLYFPGAPFIFSAVLTLIGLFITIRALIKHH
ncbi:TCR/Tet family MFS transporter [Pedobacter rhizosphaerae]|uniref:MFS transporter, DHA1 family, tetracycline resistance protein n=1 Tax=Pedobacter rhizosphaerae TaxID=390241 RepID=A0A1H9U7G4_9SPHI|nr:TCR/Tet family MFS transporter [Pedobacter rhizosphaerae]SES05520.1 MFS transporter, DHA1 family, tetracycline resistance protein [Pedobacter rhizosphaerae]